MPVSYTNDAEPSVTSSFLLKEDAFYLLLETGDKIVLTRTNEYTYDVEPS